MRVWTLNDIRNACDMTADEWSALRTEAHWAVKEPAPGVFVCELPWAWIIYIQRLVWDYGESGALARLNGERRAAA